MASLVHLLLGGEFCSTVSTLLMPGTALLLACWRVGP